MGYKIQPEFSLREKVRMKNSQEIFYVHSIRSILSVSEQTNHIYSYYIVPDEDDLKWSWSDAMNNYIVGEYQIEKI